MSPRWEPRWLESLARRAAGGSEASSVPLIAEPRDPDENLSRRTLLRLGGAALLAAGPLRMVVPSDARADAVGVCYRAAAGVAIQVLETCTKDPLNAWVTYGKAIETATDTLRDTKNPAKRRRLLKIIDEATAGQARTMRKIETCNFQFAADIDGALQNCQAQNSPGGGGGGSGGTGSPCAPGTYQCSIGPACCFGHDFCCGCAGGITCCIYSDCRCCP